MWLNKTYRLGLKEVVKIHSASSSKIELPAKLPTELPRLSEATGLERVKVCGTCQGTLPRFKGYIWVQDFRRAVDCLCGFRKGEYEIVLTRRAVEALGVIAKLANSKVYCYRERCWVRLLEPACVFYIDRDDKGIGR